MKMCMALAYRAHDHTECMGRHTDVYDHTERTALAYRAHGSAYRDIIGIQMHTAGAYTINVYGDVIPEQVPGTKS